MIEQVVGILLVFVLAVIAVRWRLFQDTPLPPLNLDPKTPKEIKDEATSKVKSMPIDDLIESNNKRYGQNSEDS